MTPWFDVLSLARFELARALRTWRALGLSLVVVVASCGGAWVFTRLLRALERELATTLGVARPDTPGAMLAELQGSALYRDLLEGLVADPQLVEAWLIIPPLALFHLWLSFAILPLFAATTAAESISADWGSRALRYEAARTGRAEIVLGRWLGQVALLAAAAAAGAVGSWLVGMTAMVGNAPLGLAVALGSAAVRGWAFALPGVGIGIAAGCLTRAPNLARGLALLVTALTPVVAAGLDAADGPWVEVIRPLLPPAWRAMLWSPGTSALWGAAACLALSLTCAAVGAARLTRSDL
jgi:hypothetical protein